MKYLIYLYIFTFLTSVPTASVFAEPLYNPLDGSGINSIPDFFRAILDIVMVFAVPLIVFFIIYAGFLYVMARGNPEKISKAHNALLFAIIGGVLILSANLLLDIVSGTISEFGASPDA